MKLLTPSIKDCRYIHRKLKQFYRESLETDGDTTPNLTEFNRALERFCDFFHIQIPKIVWYKNLNHGSQQTWGLCSPEGQVSLITPSNFDGGEYPWLDTVYHELGHYVLWSEAEKKAKIFANRMMEKWRK